MTTSSEVQTYGRREIEIVRILNAPRDRVWKAWTDPARMWIVMRAPDGSDHPMSGEFHEVVEPERLVFTGWPQDDDGVRYAATTTTVTLEETSDGKTKMSLHSVALGLLAGGGWMLEGFDEGTEQSLVRLADLVEKTPA